MSWNYRLVHVKNEIMLCEVYFDDWTGEPTHRTMNAIPILFYEDEDKSLYLERLQKAFKKPVLEDEIFADKVVF